MRASRSASPLGRSRDPTLPNIRAIGIIEEKAISKQIRDVMQKPKRVNSSDTISISQQNLAASTSGGKNRNTPPPPISVPAPPVPEVPQQWRDSSISTKSEAKTHSARTSQISNISHLSSMSTSSGSSYRSSMDSESAAVARTLGATASMKSSKEKKEKKRSRFLGKKKSEGVVKPLISPPTLVHTANTSELPKLRNRESMGAKTISEAEVMDLKEAGLAEERRKSAQEGAVERPKAVDKLSIKKSASMVDLESSKVETTPLERPKLKKSETMATTVSTKSMILEPGGKLKKSKTFGLPWVKPEARAPEAHADLVEGGFFIRTQLPPIKYTRLPVLAVNGSDLDKAGVDNAGGVRVSMQLAPVVWYDEAKRKTVRMSLQMATEQAADGAPKSNRTSWVTAGRFSWMPGKDDRLHLSHLGSPLGSAKSPRKSQLKSPLKSVMEAAREIEADDFVDTEATRKAAAARLEGVDEESEAKSAHMDPVSSSKPSQHGSQGYLKAISEDRESKDRDQSAISQEDETLEAEAVLAENEKDKPDEEGHTIRWSEGTNDDARELQLVLQQIAEEQQKEMDGQTSSVPDVNFQDTWQDQPMSLSKRISLVIKKGSPSPDCHIGDIPGASDGVATDPLKLAGPAQANNRLSWMFNTGAPAPQDVKLLAAVPREDGDALTSFEGEEGFSAANANVELRILSAYHLPEEAQVLAVITEEDEGPTFEMDEPAAHGTSDRLLNIGREQSQPMILASPGLPNMRMVGLADVEAASSSDEEESRTVDVDHEASDSESNYSKASEEDNTIDSVGVVQNKAEAGHYHTARGSAGSKQVQQADAVCHSGEANLQTTDVQPLRLSIKSTNHLESTPLVQAPYVPGPIRLTRSDDNKNAIAGMDAWHDHEAGEDVWQRSEKLLIDGILDFFSDTVSTSEWCSGREGDLVNDEDVDFSFLKAPLLDSAFIQLHAVEDIFAAVVDPSKPPPLPPLPTNFTLNRPLPSPGSEFTRDGANTACARTTARSDAHRRQKPVAVHAPGIGTLLMKGGLF
ncbi:MAG: hypothetical protein Q9162_003310 [Coniocarpon cinnabarinum]